MVSKRRKSKYPALEPRLNSRVRQEYIDYDYVDKLSDEEKKWLNDFTEEYTNGGVGKQSESEKNRFHKTPELVKECTDRNNAQNRCLYGQVRNKVGVTKLLNYDDIKNIVEEELVKEISSDNLENSIIDYLDEKFIQSSSDSEDNGDNSE